MTNPSDALRVVVGLAEKATPGAWRAEERDGVVMSGIEEKVSRDDWRYKVNQPAPPFAFGATGALVYSQHDAEAIAAAVNFIREHGAALAQALENDARYRWLRDEAQWSSAPLPIVISSGNSRGHAQVILAEEELDAAIDSAIAAQQKEAANGD